MSDRKNVGVVFFADEASTPRLVQQIEDIIKIGGGCHVCTRINANKLFIISGKDQEVKE